MEEIKVFEKEIMKITNKDLLLRQSQLQPNVTIDIDGYWDHPRNGYHCLVTAIDVQTHRVIDYQLVTRNNSKINSSANYFGGANGMESNGTKLLFQRLAKIPNIVNIVHDKDGRCSRIIKFHNFSEYFDQYGCNCF